MGLSIGPRAGANTLVIGDAAGMVNPFNGEGIAYGYESGRLAAAVLGEALLANDRRCSRSTTSDYKRRTGTTSRWRAVLCDSSPNRSHAACVGVGMRIRPLMDELLAIMANLMSNDQKGPAEVGYRAMTRLASAIPDQAWDLIFNDRADA